VDVLVETWQHNKRSKKDLAFFSFFFVRVCVFFFVTLFLSQPSISHHLQTSKKKKNKSFAGFQVEVLVMQTKNKKKGLGRFLDWVGFFFLYIV